MANILDSRLMSKGLRYGLFSDRKYPSGMVEMFFISASPGDNTYPFISAAWEREDVRLNGNPIDCCDYFRHCNAPENAE